MKEKKTKAPASELLPLRQNFKSLLLQNPNYFGTAVAQKGAVLPQVIFPLAQNVFYEELTCVGYNHPTSKLNATIKVKQASGYAGDYCIGGSTEYVRFFVDWDNNGIWTDEGMVSVAVHDHSFSDDLCYDVEMAVAPRRRRCCDKRPVLPKVRAILSWNFPPPAGNELFVPVWGNRRETNIQIAPRADWFCILDDIIVQKGIKFELLEEEIKSLEAFVPATATIKPLAATSLLDLKKVYKNEKVSETRFVYPMVANLLAANTVNDVLLKEAYSLGFDIPKVLDFIKLSKFDTSFEEVTCVGLDIATRRLHATIRVKREYGYNGALCSRGSNEYVAFYMDFGAGFQYMGTASIDVHDIPGASVGLTYDVSIPVNLDQYRQPWCKMDKAKVRAILSWDTPPPINDPNYVAPWGDWEECWVELTPLPKGTHPGQIKPQLGTVGGMDTDDINQLSGLATTASASSLNGAYQCAFDGEIQVTGRIVNTTILPVKYRFVVTEPGSAPRNLLDTQYVRRYGDLADTVLVPDADGWMPYYDDLEKDLLGRYYPGKHGMHGLRFEAGDAFGNTIDFAEVLFFVDKKVADTDITITIGPGDCGQFQVGDTIEGTYQFTDEHAWSISIYETPDTDVDIEIDGAPGNSRNYQLGTFPATGKSGTWRIITKAGKSRPCGYNVWLTAVERVILNSVQVGRFYNEPKGFCLV